MLKKKIFLMKFLMQPPDKEISHFVLYIIIEVVLLKGLARGCVLLKVLLIKTKRLCFFSFFRVSYNKGSKFHCKLQ